MTEAFYNDSITFLFGMLAMLLITTIAKLLDRAPKIVEASYDDDIMTVRYRGGKTEAFLRMTDRWVGLPLMNTIDTDLHQDLDDIALYCKTYGNPYPRRHE